MSVNTILIIITIAFIAFEWQYRVKKSGRKEGTSQIAIAGMVFLVAISVQNKWGLLGLLITLLVLIFVMIYQLISMKK